MTFLPSSDSEGKKRKKNDEKNDKQKFLQDKFSGNAGSQNFY